MAGKQDKISNTCPESCSLYSHSIAKVLLYVFVREENNELIGSYFLKMSCLAPEGEAGGPNPPGKSQVAISFQGKMFQTPSQKNNRYNCLSRELHMALCKIHT